MNEEDVRGKLLLPFLNDLGFDRSEISLEKSFSIRLGKSQQVVQGRSDILCKRNGKNLFIIELKKDSISIEQKDIDQGISYARLLLDNIAPFTIITNGKLTRIFDSISREELTGKKISEYSSYWKNDFTLSTDVDLRIRYEALKNFVSFSPDNLKIFCETQVRDRMGPIIGDTTDPYAKFVKELYIQRQELQSQFDDFINSESSVFGIVGAAGVGKTSAICSIALQKLESEFVFFYNAAIINRSPLDHIAQDLNGVFSSKTESDTVLKKLDDIGRFLDKNVLIFIDAIDESVDPNLSLELSEIALIVRSLRRVKICVSCKINIWSSILKRNNTPTHLFEEIQKTHTLISDTEGCSGYLLDNFNSNEILNIIPLYKDIFGFTGQMSEQLINSLRNGFFLRIFSEVYSGREVPYEIKDKDLIARYIKESLDKTSLGVQVGLRILSKIGKILINRKFTDRAAYKDEGLEVGSVLDELEFSMEETIPEALFARNILIRSNSEDSHNISFYYSKVRDYIICFHSFKLDKLSNDDFYDLLEKFYENYIGQSSIDFYIENASANHKSILVKFKNDKSFNYVSKYDLYLETNFKNIKEKFNPNTNGSIGIFLPIELLKEDGYALFPLPTGELSKIKHEKLTDAYKGLYYDSAVFRKGAKMLHSSHKRLLISDQDNIIRKEIFNQLRDIIYKGKISVYNSDVLLFEQVATILYFYYQKLGYDFKIKDYYLPRFEFVYPINLEDLIERIYKFRITEYYNRQDGDWKLKQDKINEAFLHKVDVPKFNVIGDVPPFEELFKIVEILIKKGYRELAEHHLPYPDVSIGDVQMSQGNRFEFDYIQSLQFTKDQGKIYIEKFLKLFESSYKDFIENIFPTYKEKLPYFMSLPHEYFVYIDDSNEHRAGCLGYRSSKTGSTEVNFRKFTSVDAIFTAGEVNSFRGFSLSQILRSDYHNTVRTVDKINTPKVDDYCVLRSWIYKHLKEDVEKLFKETTE
ncbi:type I restriction enzyme HsdR N-terminal domain-containing protein [Fibrella sp. USSR17]